MATAAPIAEFLNHSTETKDNDLSGPRGSSIGSEDLGSVNASWSSDKAFSFLPRRDTFRVRMMPPNEA
jgi:hypothetical protein